MRKEIKEKTTAGHGGNYDVTAWYYCERCRETQQLTIARDAMSPILRCAKCGGITKRQPVIH